MDRDDLYESANDVHLSCPERHSYEMIKNSGEFVINLTTKQLTRATDFCGVRSKDGNKFKEARLTKEEAQVVDAPIIAESPVNIECKVERSYHLAHIICLWRKLSILWWMMIIWEATDTLLEKTNPLIYSHSGYYETGKELGTFGYSVRRKRKGRNQMAEKNNNYILIGMPGSGRVRSNYFLPKPWVMILWTQIL